MFNLSCLAQALLPLLHEDADAAAELARNELDKYEKYFVQHYAALMRAKLGLKSREPQDQKLCHDLLDLMAANQVDYTLVFRALSQIDQTATRDLFIDRAAFDQWFGVYRQRLASEQTDEQARSEYMKSVNPEYVLRNYMAEAAIRKAEDQQDYSEIDLLLRILQKPFDEQPGAGHYAGHPPDWAQQISVSCSS